MSEGVICKTEPLDLKETVLLNRQGITNMAKYMWPPWKTCIYPSGVGIGWQAFLNLVGLNWFRFMMWASDDLEWPELEHQLARECKKKFQGCQFPPGVLSE